MPGSRSVARLLERHKSALSRELSNTSVVSLLAKRGVITAEEEAALLSETRPEARADVFVSFFAQKGFNSFRELCVTLEMECPHLLTALLLDNPGEKAMFAQGLAEIKMLLEQT